MLFYYRIKDANTLVNRHTLVAVLEFVKSQKVEIKDNPFDYMLPNEHFINWAVKDLSYNLEHHLRYEPVTDNPPNRITRKAIEFILDCIQVYGHNLTQETDTTCYAFQYGSAMWELGDKIKEHFIKTAKV